MRGAVSRYHHIASLVLGLLLAAIPVRAQLTEGDFSMNLNGVLGFGYTGDYGNITASDHGTGVNGDAYLNGFYYNPKFLNYSLNAMYNRSQENSGSGSITDATSVGGGVGIFAGSHFPGSIGFGKAIGSSGNYGLPGLPGFTTEGNSTQFGIGWAELLPGLPPVSAQYSQTDSLSSLFGSTQDEHSNARNLSLYSNYNLDGWFLSPRFNDSWSHSELPSFLTAGEELMTADNSRSFAVNATHRLPLRGALALTYTYGAFNGESDGTSTSNSNNTFSGNANFAPTTRFTTNFGAIYDSNLSGAVEQQLAAAGAVAPEVNLGTNTQSLSLNNFDSFTITKSLGASFGFTHIQQEVYGESVSANHWTAVLNYHFVKPLWGAVAVYAGVNDQSTDAGHQGTGLVAGVNFDKRIVGFEWSGSFAYAQDVQTVLATQVTSEYSYMASAIRRFSNRLLWTSNFHGFHTGLGQAPGAGSESEGYGTSLSYRGYSLGASYSESHGTALLTASGLVQAPVTIPPILNGNQYMLENGSATSVTLSANPLRRLAIGASFNKGVSDTQGLAAYTSSSSKTILCFTQWQFRKVSLGAGYTHLFQSVGTPGNLPADFSSFYVGVQRSFHAF